MSPVDGQRLTTLSKRKEGLKFDAIRLWVNFLWNFKVGVKKNFKDMPQMKCAF